ncbi:unnamed protein product [marine sediment metagenome]|uniref:Uncharacterized protein n=1 Tax=marine sediment metagenome TaxID=412755 RepID=X1ICX2_9ZZZZ
MITMLFQVESEFTGLVIGIVIAITVSIIVFIIGMYTMRWYAKKKGWDDSIKTAFIVNIVLLILNIPINLLFYFQFGDNLITVEKGKIIDIIRLTRAITLVLKTK